MEKSAQEIIAEALKLAADDLGSKLPWSIHHSSHRNQNALDYINRALESILGHDYMNNCDENIDVILKLINKIKHNPF